MLLGILFAVYLNFYVSDISYILQGPGIIQKMDFFDPYWMTVWIVFLSPAWFLGLWEYEDEFKRAPMTVLRYHILSKWWMRINLKVIAEVVLSYCVMGLILMVFLQSEWEKNIGLSIALIMLHALALMIYALWIRVLTGKMITSVIIILIFEITAKIFVVEGCIDPMYCPFSWGMLNYCSLLYGDSGFDLITIVIFQSLILMSPVLFVVGYLKEILIRRI